VISAAAARPHAFKLAANDAIFTATDHCHCCMVGSFFRRVTDAAATGCILETRTLPDEFLHLTDAGNRFHSPDTKKPGAWPGFVTASTTCR